MSRSFESSHPTSVQVHLTISRKMVCTRSCVKNIELPRQLKNAKNFIELYFKTASPRERQEFKQQMIQIEAKFYILYNCSKCSVEII